MRNFVLTVFKGDLSSMGIRGAGLCVWAGWGLVSAMGAEHPDPLPVKDSQATTQAEMKPYQERIEHARAKIPMVPIPGGTFRMGSSPAESNRQADEGPQHQVTVAPFWMGKYEITWDAYEVWMSDTDILKRKVLGLKPNQRDKIADKYQLTQPTEPYTDMSFGMGKRRFPAHTVKICLAEPRL